MWISHNKKKYFHVIRIVFFKYSDSQKTPFSPTNRLTTKYYNLNKKNNN